MNTTGQRPRNLILIGFMGTGKTTIGKRVAKSLGFSFVDTDALIVEETGKPISQIFEESGENHFRHIETATLKRVGEQSCQVISTGGGVVTQPENLRLLQQAGFVVWLKASPASIYERVRRNRNRPLLNTQNPLQTIERLLEQRTPLYQQAQHLSIMTDGLSTEEVCFGICESLAHELRCAANRGA